MKKYVLLAVVLMAVLVSPVTSFGQSVLNSPTAGEIESLVKGMGLSMEQKLSLRTIFQGMREQGEKVLGNSALTEAQKTSQITQIRQGALSKTSDIVNASQQQQLQSLLLPGQ